MKLLVALLICIAVFAAEATRKARILYGYRVTDIRLFPWNAAILLKPYTKGSNQIKDRFYCSSSIIGRRKILTAGHCVCKYAVENFKIMVGTRNAYVASPNNVYNAVRKFQHPKMLKEPRRGCGKRNYINRNDIAILETDRDIQFNAKVKPIEVDFNRIAGAIPIFIMGYGRTESERDRRKKGKGDLKYADTKAWMCSSPRVFIGMLCTSRRNNSIYRGDSGGPLVTFEGGVRQIGINEGITRRTPRNIFVSTHYQADFIKPHVDE